MVVWTYQYAGLLISSQIEINEWAPFACEVSNRRCDVWIALDPDPSLPSGPANAALGSDGFWWINIPQIALFRVGDGCQILVTPVVAASSPDLRPLLLGEAWAALCYQRQILALHMGVSMIYGKAVAFCGASGAGKSSMVASLMLHGHRLICDDLCNVAFGLDRAFVYPGVPRLKLCRDACEAFRIDCATLHRDPLGHDKLHIPGDLVADSPGNNLAAVQLAAIMILDWGDLGLETLSGRDMLIRLVNAATYRSSWLQPMNIRASYWNNCLRLAARQPVWLLRRPRNWTKFGETTTFLVEKIKTI